MRIQTYLLLAGVTLMACDENQLVLDEAMTEGDTPILDSNSFGILNQPNCPPGTVQLGPDGQFSDDAVNYVHAALPTAAATNLAMSINNARHTVFLTYNAFRVTRAGAGSYLIRPTEMTRETTCSFGKCRDRLTDVVRICVPTSHPSAGAPAATLNFCNWAFGSSRYQPIANNISYKFGKAETPVDPPVASTCGTSYTHVGSLRYTTRQSMVQNENVVVPNQCKLPTGANPNDWILKQATEVTADLASSVFGGDSDCQHETAAMRRNSGYTVQWCCAAQKNFDINGSGVVTMADMDSWIVKYGHQASRGDYDGNGFNDGNDWLIWQRSYGMGGRFKYGDANGDGSVDAADYVVWRNLFGSATPIAEADKIADINLDGAINWDDYVELCRKLSITP
jgi:hypothetical protein